MSEQKCISTNETNPPRASSTKSPSKTEPVIEGPTISYYWWFAFAVAITAVVLGVYFFNRKEESSSPQGLVFYWDTIALQTQTIQEIDERGIQTSCELVVGGKSRAEMWKKQIKRISVTKKLYIIEDNTTMDIKRAAAFISLCMLSLGLSEVNKNVYVWESTPHERLNEINSVIKKTGLEGATLQFICRTGPKCDFLKDNKFNVFEVGDHIQESDFQGMI